MNCDPVPPSSCTYTQVLDGLTNVDTTVFFFYQPQVPHGYHYWVESGTNAIKRYDSNADATTTTYTDGTDIPGAFIFTFDPTCGTLPPVVHGVWRTTATGGAPCGGNMADTCYLVCNAGYDVTGDGNSVCAFGVYESDHSQQCDEKPTVAVNPPASAVPRELITFSGSLSTHFCWNIGDSVAEVADPVCTLTDCSTGWRANGTLDGSTAKAGRGLDVLKVVPCCDSGLNTCVLQGDLTTIEYHLDYTRCVGCEYMFNLPDGRFVYDCKGYNEVSYARVENDALAPTELCPV